MKRYVYLNTRYYTLLHRLRMHKEAAKKQLQVSDHIEPILELSICKTLEMLNAIEMEMKKLENRFAEMLPNALIMQMLYNENL